MGVRACRVTVHDLDGIEHTAEVTASSLYEAVAIGLRVIRDSEWAGQLPQSLGKITVSSAPVHVEHTVKFDAFNRWIRQQGRGPADMMQRRRIRELLER